MTTHPDLWSAMLPNGDVRSGTLEQLKEALRSGHLGGGTMVRAHRSNSNHWTLLSDVLPTTIASEVRATRVPSPVAAVPPQPGPSPSDRDAALWQVRLANGEVRAGTRQQLQEAFRAGHLNEHMPILAAGATDWVQLGTVMSRGDAPPALLGPSAPPAPPAVSAVAPGPTGGVVEVWQVKLADGQVRSGTRQQLEDALRAGHVDEGTLVLTGAASEWTTLGALRNRVESSGAVATDPPRELGPAQEGPAPAAAVVMEGSTVAEGAATPTAPDGALPMCSEDALQESDAPPAQEGAARLDAGDREAESSGVRQGNPQWQIQLTDEQLDEAFRVGLLGEDALVLAIGTDQWVRFGDLQRPSSTGAAAVGDEWPSS